MTRLYSLSAKKFLNIAVTVWFIVAVVGQWIFATYVILFYGKATATGHNEDWNKVLPHGYVAGETTGNVVVGIHLLLTIIIVIGGPLQIIPRVRKSFPVIHRWTGRIYILVAFVMSLSGLFMVWVRGSVGGITQHISISFNAVLIMISAVCAIRYARRRDFKRHSIWAMRLFLFVNGVWFFRVGLHFWLLINEEPVGFDLRTFQGPFLTFLSISQYGLPFIFFEMYLKASNSANRIFVFSTTSAIFLFTAIMAIGIFAATVGSWWPKMN